MKKRILISVLLVWLLTSCWKDLQEVDVKNNTKTKTSSGELDVVVNEVQQVLVIDKKCVWCGKCTNISPQNFKMNFQSYKAEVISQENIEFINVDMAIDRCPVDAISIINS